MRELGRHIHAIIREILILKAKDQRDIRLQTLFINLVLCNVAQSTEETLSMKLFRLRAGLHAS